MDFSIRNGRVGGSKECYPKMFTFFYHKRLFDSDSRTISRKRSPFPPWSSLCRSSRTLNIDKNYMRILRKSVREIKTDGIRYTALAARCKSVHPYQRASLSPVLSVLYVFLTKIALAECDFSSIDFWLFICNISREPKARPKKASA